MRELMSLVSSLQPKKNQGKIAETVNSVKVKKELKFPASKKVIIINICKYINAHMTVKKQKFTLYCVL